MNELDNLKEISKELQRINYLLDQAIEKYPTLLEMHEKAKTFSERVEELKVKKGL